MKVIINSWHWNSASLKKMCGEGPLDIYGSVSGSGVDGDSFIVWASNLHEFIKIPIKACQPYGGK